MDNEAEYLELCEHFKKTVDDKDKSIKMLLMLTHELKKEILTSYGIVRMLDREVSAVENMPCNIRHLVEDLRGHLSDYYDKLFPLP
jgi:hypothetical protein